MSLCYPARSRALTGTGPLAGFGEWIVGFLMSILAAGFILVVIAGEMRLIAKRRPTNSQISN
jgi:hypothetical protein